MTQPSNYPLWAWRRRLAGEPFITYDQTNWHNVNRPYGPKPANIIAIKDAPGYPYVSTTNQRRRRKTFAIGDTVFQHKMKGHRGYGTEQKPILQKGVVDEKGHQPMLQVGIWRGIDGTLAKSLGTRYTGEKLREIRAIKGVGRPWVTLLRSDPQPSTGSA